MFALFDGVLHVVTDTVICTGIPINYTFSPPSPQRAEDGILGSQQPCEVG